MCEFQNLKCEHCGSRKRVVLSIYIRQKNKYNPCYDERRVALFSIRDIDIIDDTSPLSAKALLRENDLHRQNIRFRRRMICVDLAMYVTPKSYQKQLSVVKMRKIHASHVRILI